jgi:predicted O-methyltransferase YrrM
MALPLIDAEVGALLEVLARLAGATRILEIGTAIGYSTLWLARALPADGVIFTIEIDPERAALARSAFERAGVASKVNVMVGDASRLIHKVAGPFDLVFQDGHKPHYAELLDRVAAVLRPGGVLVTDNVLWDGEVVPGFRPTPTRDTVDTEAVARFNERIATDARFRTSWLPLRDGVAVSVKVSSQAATGRGEAP